MNEIDEPVEDWQPGPEVTPALYAAWRNARRGDSHAVKMNNPVWDWLIRTRIAAYTANRHFSGPDSLAAGPAWCFCRYGQSRTVLPDGRILLIAGEHEDFYDPDFFIYNDVVVIHPGGSVDIHGYPASDFPPTDFHSATLFGDRLLLIGNLGYIENRQPGITPVLSLDVRSLKIEQIATAGENPGWIFRHRAELDGDCIVVRGGEIQLDGAVLENIDDWLLNLNSWKWTRLTDRQWPRFEIVRQDEEMNHLWQIRHELFMQEFQSRAELTAETREAIRTSQAMVRAVGIPGDTDPELLARLYVPDVAHVSVPRDQERFDEHNVYRIAVDGVIVRYVEDSHAVVLTVEGALPEPILDLLVADLRGKLSRLENAEFIARRW